MKTSLVINNETIELGSVEKKPGAIRFELNGKKFHYLCQRLQDGSVVLDEEIAPGVWRRVTGTVSPAGKGQFRVALGHLEAKVSPILAGGTAMAQASKLSPTAPMPGLVRQILVKVGEKVQVGQALVVMEAMKLQTTLTAGGVGVVEAIVVKEGQQVQEGAELVRVKA